jgi:PAS domain S-box-containing protein
LTVADRPGEDGRIVDINPAAEAILGHSRDQTLGTTSMDPQWQWIREDGTRFPGEQHPAMVTLRTGQPVRNQIIGIRTLEAGVRWFSINSHPVDDPDVGGCRGIATTFIDVTDQKQLIADLNAARADALASPNFLDTSDVGAHLPPDSNPTRATA